MDVFFKSKLISESIIVSKENFNSFVNCPVLNPNILYEKFCPICGKRAWYKTTIKNVKFGYSCLNNHKWEETKS